MKTALVLGAGGFIGHHLVRRLKAEDYWVRGVDLKKPRWSQSNADEFYINDMRSPLAAAGLMDREFDEVYQLAADMGGAGYIFSGDHDFVVARNSVLINANVLTAVQVSGCAKRVFFSSSACVYPQENQADPHDNTTAEHTAYPANPDSEYGWEKLFSERLYQAYARNHNLQVRIARYHNVFGPEGAWNDGREKAPAAICRKIAEAPPSEPDGADPVIDVWGDGEQTRSFLYVDECITATLRLMRSDFQGPVNIGSDHAISIDDLVRLVARIAGKTIRIHHIPGPQGVRGRVSDNTLIRQALDFVPASNPEPGLRRTYEWIKAQVEQL